MVSKDFSKRVENFSGYTCRKWCCERKRARNLQYHSFCSGPCQKAHVHLSHAIWWHFRIGSARSKELGLTYFPSREVWLSFQAHLEDANVRTVLLINNVDRLGTCFDDLKNSLVHASSGTNTSISSVNWSPFVSWDQNLTCMLTVLYICRPHCIYRDSPADNPTWVLKRADTKEVSANTRNVFWLIEKNCDFCRKYKQKAHCFKFALSFEKDYSNMTYAEIYLLRGNLSSVSSTRRPISKLLAGRKSVIRSFMQTFKAVMNWSLRLLPGYDRSWSWKIFHGRRVLIQYWHAPYSYKMYTC